jgi:hypothetical protein
MRILRLIYSAAICFAFLQNISGQGFVNLDFEQANIPPTPAGQLGGFADPALAFPGWIVGPGVVGYNTLSLGSAAEILIGPNYPNGIGYSSLQGSYSVLLQTFSYNASPASLSQTALIPANAKSISMLGAAYVSLNGVSIPLLQLQDGRWAGDISAYAGNIAQLTLSGPSSGTGWMYFDDIQFSPASVPEPSVLSLFGVSALFICLRMLRSNNSLQATRDGRSSSASRFTHFGPACLSSGR